MNEIDKYHYSLMQDVSARQLSSEDGDTQEQTFTRMVLELLVDAGETENADAVFDEKALGTRNQHKINGYAIADNYETVDLFITIFKPDDAIRTVTKAEVDQAATRIGNFFRKAVYDEYANEVAESSPIFEFAHTLASYDELRNNLVRVNAFVLTNGSYKGDVPVIKDISGYKFFYRIVDINYLFQISGNSKVPVEIDFSEGGFLVPCLQSPRDNPEYQTYLAIFPGNCLYSLYERFGSRLLEQNVRSFLQFNGKINKGIRKTINEQPHRFLAYNNGLSITADALTLDDTGKYIRKISNLQIVNGGQTTASIYYTSKKDKASLDDVFVQTKISVIKDKDDYAEIVSSISRCANTQNKVSTVDLTANNPSLVELEKLSRYTITPVSPSNPVATYWFFERARGQYKTLRQREGFTKSRQKAFDLKTPLKQMFTKADLAKFINSYGEVRYEGQLVIGPHIVSRGAEKNYAQFVNYNLPEDAGRIDSIFYEDLIAKAIIYRTAVRRYGTKAQSFCIGDLRSAVVPYAVSLLYVLTKGKLDLYRIWKRQSLSEELSDFLYDLMKKLNGFIISECPVTNYTEWVKKEDCWNRVREHDWGCDLSAISADFVSGKNKPRRSVSSDDVKARQKVDHDMSIIRAIPPELWKKFAEWGRDSGCLSINQQSAARDIAYRLRYNWALSDSARNAGISIYEIVCEKNIELLEQADLIRTEGEIEDERIERCLYGVELHVNSEAPGISGEPLRRLVFAYVDAKRSVAGLSDRYPHEMLHQLLSMPPLDESVVSSETSCASWCSALQKLLDDGGDSAVRFIIQPLRNEAGYGYFPQVEMLCDGSSAKYVLDRQFVDSEEYKILRIGGSLLHDFVEDTGYVRRKGQPDHPVRSFLEAFNWLMSAA